ncbi:hypothetical protein DFR55_10871 [Herbinix hemicellulosilytica]|uniref:Putative secreted protein n=1 Tax=Herbinix hemicellulosilytica TaxID=1564487 RepID=A0A0H5SEW7_HERHM|nr:membrane lipoprotein lipid attachment site-containing protein [Herbinix hemicellulosilytica]RBP59010.1 hypothetical protein DFR55_10871 [Herbinix hemicellulosilytica]CRZ33964.1 putative secreted protein [Herbinix hemicellulosilytica]
MKRMIFIIGICVFILSGCSGKTKLTSLQSIDSIGYITDIKNGKLYMSTKNLRTDKSEIMYYKNSLLKKSLFVDDSSVSSYHLLKGNNESMSLLFDSKQSKLYKIDSERTRILGETLNYVFFYIIDDDYIHIHQLNKITGEIEFTDKIIEITGEIIGSKATSNFDTDELYWYYSMDGKTYRCKINSNNLKLIEVLNYPTSNIFCLDKSGDICLCLYNAANVPYSFEPVIIRTDSSSVEITLLNNDLDEGMIDFSLIYNDTFYMGYRSGSLLTLYSWNQSDSLKKLKEYANVRDIAWTIYDDKLYIYYDEKLSRIN